MQGIEAFFDANGKGKIRLLAVFGKVLHAFRKQGSNFAPGEVTVKAFGLHVRLPPSPDARLHRQVTIRNSIIIADVVLAASSEFVVRALFRSAAIARMACLV